MNLPCLSNTLAAKAWLKFLHQRLLPLCQTRVSRPRLQTPLTVEQLESRLVPTYYNYGSLYSFAGGTSDGAIPYGNLITDSSGNLFGTTAGGGANNCGT